MERPWTVVVPKPPPAIKKAAVDVVETEVADEVER